MCHHWEYEAVREAMREAERTESERDEPERDEAEERPTPTPADD